MDYVLTEFASGDECGRHVLELSPVEERDGVG